MSLHGLCKTNPVGGRLGVERRLGTLLYDFMTLHNLSSLLDSFLMLIDSAKDGLCFSSSWNVDLLGNEL